MTAFFAGPVSTADRAQLTANARAAVDGKCLTESQDLYLLLSGYTGPDSSDDRGFGIGSPGWLSLDVQRVIGDDKKSVTVFLDDPRIGEYDLGCVDIRLSADGAQVDGLPPVFFGDGVDTDSDGVDDSKDLCPQIAARTADGCPTATGNTGTTSSPLATQRRPPPAGRVSSSSACLVPDLRGSTIAGAKRRLANANCTLGKVIRAKPKHAKGPWKVRSQRSKPGAEKAPGAPVTVVVARRRAA